MDCNKCREPVDACDCSSDEGSTPEHTNNSCEPPKLTKKKLDKTCNLEKTADPCRQASLERAMTAIAALPVRDNPCCHREDASERSTRSISSKSENSCSTVAEAKGVILVRGKGLPSLIIGFLMSAVDISRNWKWLLFWFCVLVGLAALFYSLLPENSCYNADSEMVYSLKKRLTRAHHELQYMEKRIQQTERKLTSVLSVAKTLMEHGAFDNGDDQYTDLLNHNKRCSGRR